MAVGVAGLLLAAGGCASSSGNTSSAPATTPPATTSPATTPPISSTTTPAAGGSTAAPAPTAGVKDCLTRNLEVTDVVDPSGGAAGHHAEFLVFRNTAGFPCTLDGFPGVSFVAGDKGTQVGTAFVRSNARRHPITLAPGERVHATILIADYQNVDAASCKPVQVRGYRVYPPNETAAVFVPRAQTACSAPNEAAGQVQPVAPGASGA